MIEPKVPKTGDPSVDAMLQIAYIEGAKEGVKRGLDWLETQYIGKNRPKRGSTQAQAILSVAAGLGELWRELFN